MLAHYLGGRQSGTIELQVIYSRAKTAHDAQKKKRSSRQKIDTPIPGRFRNGTSGEFEKQHDQIILREHRIVGFIVVGLLGHLLQRRSVPKI